MKLLILLILALPTLGFSQTKSELKKTVNPLPLFTSPEFVGGQKALDFYIEENFKVSRKDKKNNIKGEIIVKFFVQSDGTITSVKIIKGLTEKLNNEAIKVMSNMPKWKAGTKNGKVVEVMYAYTISV